MNAVEYCLLHGLKLAGPEHPALLCAQESLSYGALAARVSQFAAGLREAGVRPNDRVGMLMLDTPDLIALHLGAVAAGAIAVAMSSRASAAELAQILAIVRPAAVVVDAEFAGVAAGAVEASSPNTRLIWRDRELRAWKASPTTMLAPVRRQLGDPAFWVMTSGTTGRPKAVEHRHSNVGICAQYYERVLSCTRRDRLFATYWLPDPRLPLAFAAHCRAPLLTTIHALAALTLDSPGVPLSAAITFVASTRAFDIDPKYPLVWVLST